MSMELIFATGSIIYTIVLLVYRAKTLKSLFEKDKNIDIVWKDLQEFKDSINAKFEVEMDKMKNEIDEIYNNNICDLKERLAITNDPQEQEELTKKIQEYTDKKYVMMR